MRNMQKSIILFITCILTVLISEIVYAADIPVELDLCVEQVFHGGAANVDCRFQYELRPISQSSPMPANPRVIIAGTNECHIDTITFTQTGVYQYEMKMVSAPSGADYTCDTQVYTITVLVTESVNNLIAETVIMNGQNTKTTSMLFTHSYSSHATDPNLMVDPPVKKMISGSPAEVSTFTFALTARDKSNPMPEGSKDGVKTIRIAGSGEKDFGTWSYTEAGVFYYNISEVDTEEDGYIYDTSVYTITDTVKDVNGQLELTRVVTNHANKCVDSCIFINNYASDGGISAGLDGPKTGDDVNTTAMRVIISVFSFIAAGCFCYLLLENQV